MCFPPSLSGVAGPSVAEFAPLSIFNEVYCIDHCLLFLLQHCNYYSNTHKPRAIAGIASKTFPGPIATLAISDLTTLARFFQPSCLLLTPSVAAPKTLERKRTSLVSRGGGSGGCSGGLLKGINAESLRIIAFFRTVEDEIA